MTTDPATSADPQAGDTDTNPQPQAGATSTDPQAGESHSNDTISLEDAKKLRSEAANLRSRLRSAEAKAKELDDLKAQIEQQNLSEKEKLEKKLADVEKAHADAVRQAQEYKINSEVRIQATQLGFADPNDAIRFLDLSQIDYDESGAPTNVHDLLKALVKAKSYLAGKAQAQQTSGGATNPSRSTTTTPPQISEEYLSKLTPAMYEALTPEQRADITRWRLSHPPGYGQRMR